MRDWGGRRFWGMAAVLFVFWVLITGRLDILNVGIGIIIAIGITKFNSELLFSYKELPPLTLHNAWVLIRHVGLLITEIIKANWIMARIVLSRDMDIDPGLVIFKPRLQSELIQVLLANSISLTPGTLTIDVQDDVFTVHTIDRRNAPALADWNVEKQLEEITEVPR